MDNDQHENYTWLCYNNFLKNVSKKFGSIKNCLTFAQQKNTMRRVLIHTETKSWFNPQVDYICCGACNTIN